MAKRRYKTLSSEIPNRLCLGCGYPLTPGVRSQCPECGREFDPGDATTYGSRFGQLNSYTIGGFIGNLCIPLVFLVLYCMQCYVMDCWHNTNTSWFPWLGGHPGTWWELNGLGVWLWPMQMVVFMAHSVVSGKIIGQITIDRRPRKMNG